MADEGKQGGQAGAAAGEAGDAGAKGAGGDGKAAGDAGKDAAAAAAAAGKNDAAANQGDLLTSDEGKDGKASDAAAEFEPKLPEGFKLDESLGKDLKAFVKAEGLNAKQAQAAVDLHIKARQAADKALETGKAEMIADWKKAAAADKEYGGAKFQENLKGINEAYQKFAPADFKELMKAAGLASHPAVLRHFYGLSKRDAEAGPPKKGSAAGEDVERERLRKRYPTMHPQG